MPHYSTYRMLQNRYHTQVIMFNFGHNERWVSPYTTGDGGRIRYVVVAQVQNLDARESHGHLARDICQISVGEAEVVRYLLQRQRQQRALHVSSGTRHLRKLYGASP